MPKVTQLVNDRAMIWGKTCLTLRSESRMNLINSCQVDAVCHGEATLDIRCRSPEFGRWMVYIFSLINIRER